MGTQLPPSVIYARLAPGDLLIAALWLIGLWLIKKARTDLPWHEKGRAPNTSRPTQSRSQEEREKWSTGRVLLIFTLAALVTLAAGGVPLESRTPLSPQVGLCGVRFRFNRVGPSTP